MKRVESLVGLFAHLITRNSEQPFNEIWDIYFRPFEIGNMNIDEVNRWLLEEIKE